MLVVRLGQNFVYLLVTGGLKSNQLVGREDGLVVLNDEVLQLQDLITRLERHERDTFLDFFCVELELLALAQHVLPVVTRQVILELLLRRVVSFE